MSSAFARLAPALSEPSVTGPMAAASPAQPEESEVEEGLELSEDKLQLKATGLVEEHHNNGSVASTIANLRDMRQAGASMPQAVAAILVAALNHRGIALEARLPPFIEVMGAAVEADDGTLSASELNQGAVCMAQRLHVVAEEMPKGPGELSHFFSHFILSGAVNLGDVLRSILEVPAIEEDGDVPLVEADQATAFIYTVMSKLKEAKGEAAAAALWKDSGVELKSFVSSLSPMEPSELHADADGHGLGFLVPL